jgi:hypothetical protein
MYRINLIKFSLIASLMAVLISCSDDSLKYAETSLAIDPVMKVYKSPTCGCCGAWVENAQAAGFQTLVEHPDDLDAIKQQLGITNRYRSCHTAVYKDFVFEGHIPAKFIQQFIANPPANAIGLAVPGMPLGSPGMEVEDRFNPYTIYQVNADGEPTVFAMIDNMADQY